MRDRGFAGFDGPGPDRVFEEALSHGRFRIQHCAACNSHVFYPRLVCPHCGDAQLGWVTPSGAATVYSTTVIRRKAEKGGDYNVAVVDLAEGPRLMTRVEGIPPAEVRIGMAVYASVKRTEKGPLLVFLPKETT